MFSLIFNVFEGRRWCLVLIAFLLIGCGGGGEGDDVVFDDGRSWGEADVVASGPNAGVVESLYVAEDDVYVSWVSWVDGLYSIWFAHHADGAGWGDGLSFSGNYGSQVIGGGGNVFMGWNAPDFSSRFALDDMVVARYVVGSGLELPLVLNAMDTRVSSTTLSVGASGVAVAVWVQDDDSRVGNLWASYYSLDSGWGVAQLLGGTDVRLGWQSGVSVDKFGNAMVIWGESSSGRYEALWSSYYSSVSGWGAARGVAVDVDYSVLAANDAGDSMVIWSDASGYWARQYDVATGWQSSVFIKSHSGDSQWFVADMDGQGNVVVAWSGDQGIWVQHYSITDDWQSAILLVSASDLGAVSLDVAENGDAVLGWRNRQASTQFWSSYYVLGEGWGRAKLVSAGGEYLDDTFVSMRKEGGAVAAWLQVDAGETRVLSSFYE